MIVFFENSSFRCSVAYPNEYSVARAVEVVQSNTEYTEEDVTDDVLKGGSLTFGSSDRGVFDFSGLRRDDIEMMERKICGGLSRLFEGAEERKNGLFDVSAKYPHIFDAGSSSSPSMRRGIPIEEYHRRETQGAGINRH